MSMAETAKAVVDAEIREVPAVDDAVPRHSDQLSTTLPPDEHPEQHPGQQSESQTGPQAQQLFSQQQSPDQQQTESPAPAAAATASNASPLPTAFPKKRRGRPPGRPNTTVRDADYEENPLVRVWNAAKAERAVPVVTVGIRDALTQQSLVHETQRAIFRLPSRETIHFVQGWITAKHIASQRPSYVNGLLIHSRGQDALVSCAQCVEKRAKNALGPFLTCRILPGSYHNSCSNCKWFDNTSTCSLYTGPKPNRKRKAKEQLPPPPAGGVGPPSNSDTVTGDVSAAAPANDGHGSAQPELQSLGQAQPEQQPVTHAHPFPLPQPEADMMPPQEGVHGEQSNESPTSGSTDNDPSAHAEISPTHSQPDSLTGPHFAISRGERADDGDDEDPDFVAVQLAAQLLPELHRQDA
ncbi:hypothetical protein VTI74DRAFT_3871 [Chaetomium olivicolor]